MVYYLIIWEKGMGHIYDRRQETPIEINEDVFSAKELYGRILKALEKETNVHLNSIVILSICKL